MFRRLYCAGRLLTILAFAGAVALAIAHPLWAASCVGPAALEARVQSHPDAGAYEALGIWFGENDKSECAAQAFQAGLKLDPDSARLPYLLGLKTGMAPARTTASGMRRSGFCRRFVSSIRT